MKGANIVVIFKTLTHVLGYVPRRDPRFNLCLQSMRQISDQFDVKEAVRPRSFDHRAPDIATDRKVNVQSMGGVPLRNPEVEQVTTGRPLPAVP